MSQVMDMQHQQSSINMEDISTDLSIRLPSATSKIFKDECMWCFNTPFHPGGLFVCMKTFAGFCVKHVKVYCEKTGQKALLLVEQTKFDQLDIEGPQDKVTKLAINVDGGFRSAPISEITSHYSLVIFPEIHQKIAVGRLKGDILNVCQKIIDSESAQRIEHLQTGVSGWDGESKLVTKHANLHQLNNGVKIAKSGWKCGAEGCDLKENLWLNLTDGAIKCGRSQYIQEGVLSKGNNHMRQHYDETGHPLVVKLGTITKDDADVFSYDEDDSVYDPNLAQHLMHFGIDIKTTEKTEKSTLELELDMNQKWEWEMCQEDGANLELAYGPGLTGMINIGSSCYMNSSIQMLAEVPDFCKMFGGEGAAKIFLTTCDDVVSSHDDFNCQTAKVFSSLLNGDYSQRGGKLNGIKPVQFKRVVGRGHPEFGTAKQQDAEEYIRYFLSKVDDNCLGKESNPVDSIRFKMESRFTDCSSKQVRYQQKEELILSLDVPLSMARKSDDKVDEDGQPLRPTLSLDQCFAATFAEQTIEDFRSPVTSQVGRATMINRIATFPDYLLIHLQKFYVAENWNIKKMDVNVIVEEMLDLKAFRGQGQQPNEILTQHDSIDTSTPPQMDNDIVESLCSMGFSVAASRRAVYMTKSRGIAEASDWLMTHLNDPDINEEHPDLMPKHKMSNMVDVTMVNELTALGCTPYQARYALIKNSNNVNAAAEWLFSNMDQLPVEEPSNTGSDVVRTCRDGNTKYSLVGFISHMGTSPHTGHYVAHLKKDNKWYLFNDEKVALSQKPPSALAYIYLYKRL